MIQAHGNVTNHGDGTYTIAPPATSWTHGLSLPPLPHTTGKTLLVELDTPPTLGRLVRVGFSEGDLLDYPVAGLFSTDVPNLKAQELTAGSRKSWQLLESAIGPATTYQVAIEMVAGGFVYWLRGGAYPDWTPIWKSDLMPSGNVTPIVACARGVTLVRSMSLVDGFDGGQCVLAAGHNKTGFHGAGLATDGQRLLCHWQEGGDHRADDTVVKHSYSDDDGATWSAPQVVATPLANRWLSHGVIGYAGGKWWLFWIDMAPVNAASSTDRTRYATSADGENWTASQEFAPGTGRLLIFNRPVEWNGAVYVTGTRGILPHVAVVFRSTDGGANWTEHPIPVSVDEMEGELVDEGGVLACYLRTSLGHVRKSVSSDGQSWSMSHPTQWPNPNSRVTQDGGVFVGSLNHTNVAAMGRSNIATWQSDGSARWVRRADNDGMALAYPSICGGHIAYSVQQRDRDKYSMIVFRRSIA